MKLNIKLCVTRFEYEEPKMGSNFPGRRKSRGGGGGGCVGNETRLINSQLYDHYNVGNLPLRLSIATRNRS